MGSKWPSFEIRLLETDTRIYAFQTELGERTFVVLLHFVLVGTGRISDFGVGVGGRCEI